MVKCRVLTPIKTNDGIIHEKDAIVDLTEQDARNCLSFKAIAIMQDPQPAPQEVQGDPVNTGEGQ